MKWVGVYAEPWPFDEQMNLKEKQDQPDMLVAVFLIWGEDGDEDWTNVKEFESQSFNTYHREFLSFRAIPEERWPADDEEKEKFISGTPLGGGHAIG